VDPRHDDLADRLLATIFERAADAASQALTVWLGRPVHMAVSEVREVDLAEGAGLLGPGESLVAACVLGLEGRLGGQILLVFEDDSGLALADLLLNRPLGTSDGWGELEVSAALETANIVGCALLNSLASHLPPVGPGPETPLVPTPPEFRHEFAGSLLEFVLMEPAMTSDRVVVTRSAFTLDGKALKWSLLFVPGGETLRRLASALSGPAGG
jgi:chemotaxis protein CheC